MNTIQSQFSWKRVYVAAIIFGWFVLGAIIVQLWTRGGL